jgi:hypothetical protein
MIIPTDREKERQTFELDASNMQRDHVADFLQSVTDRSKPDCDTEDGYYSTTTVQLGMISYHAGSRIEWDEERKQLKGNAEAMARLKRAYREPWSHPYEG